MAGSLSGPSRMFEGAHNLVFHHPTFIGSVGQIPGKLGLDKLLTHSMRDAFHDSSNRWPPPRCHYDSRQALRKTITDWGTGRSNTIHRFMLWMHGPFGVGKSAVAQSCAETLAGKGVLGASLFFSRPNQRNDPNRVFTSIAYQLVIKCPLLGDILNHKILNNPTLLTAALPHQFLELLVKPLREMTQITPTTPDLTEWVVILDGLDEIDGVAAQCEIINIVATSIRDRTTPFRWFILSRPEPHIQRVMHASDVASLFHGLDLPISPKNDHEILTFFVMELQKIGKQHSLPASWCSDADFNILVKLAGGLWIYVNTVTRFIGDTNSLGPRTQLRLVISLAQRQKASLRTNPLAKMDLFYDLIMQQIPSDVVSAVRAILLLRQMIPAHGVLPRNFEIFIIANILQLTIEEFCTACGFLQSVLYIVHDGDQPSDIRFYHASFMEYMLNSERSGELCLGESLEDLRQEIIILVNFVHSRSKDGRPDVSLTWESEINWGGRFARVGLVYYAMIHSMIALCTVPSAILPSTAASLRSVDFSLIARLLKPFTSGMNINVQDLVVDYKALRENLPPEYQNQIIRISTDPLHLNKKSNTYYSKHAFILGSGSHKLVCWPAINRHNHAVLNLAYFEYLTRNRDVTKRLEAKDPRSSQIEGINAPDNQESRTTHTKAQGERRTRGTQEESQRRWVTRWFRAFSSHTPTRRKY